MELFIAYRCATCPEHDVIHYVVNTETGEGRWVHHGDITTNVLDDDGKRIVTVADPSRYDHEVTPL